jgi:hypothetical protein
MMVDVVLVLVLVLVLLTDFGQQEMLYSKI